MSTILFVILFVIIVAIAAIHYFWEGVFLPQYRFCKRYELFRLRDELRLLWLDGEIGDEHFKILQQSINASIKYLRYYNLTIFVESARYYKENDDIKQEFNRINEFLDNCESNTFQAIRRERLRILVNVLVCNCGLAIIDLFPLAIAVWILSRIGRLTKDTIQTVSERFTICPPPHYS